MNRALLRKCLAEAWVLWLACALLLFAFAWIRVWVVSLIETPRFASVVEQFWDKWEQFSPVSLQQLISYQGRVAMTFVEPSILFLVTVWAIARGSDVVSGEINRGSMELLLAQPVSRLQVLATQAGVTTVGAALLALAAWAGVWVGLQVNEVKIEEPPPPLSVPYLGIELPNPFAEPVERVVPMSELVDARDILPAAFNLFALTFCVAGLSTLASSWDRYRWRTIGVVSGVYVVAFILKGLALATPRLAFLKYLTFFTPFEPQKWVAIAVDDAPHTWAWVLLDESGRFAELGPLGNHAILLGIGLAGYVLAGVIFCRRDLPAPL